VPVSPSSSLVALELTEEIRTPYRDPGDWAEALAASRKMMKNAVQ
jgi:hypothetical protein